MSPTMNLDDYLQRYREYRPTLFDPRGAFLDDERQNWWVAPCGHNRDSSLLEESNWEAQLAELGGEGDDVEVAAFNHWGPGWFEIVLVRPGSDAAHLLERLVVSLSDYPVLDDEDFSRREYEATLDAIEQVGGRYVSPDAPIEWPSEVWEWLDNNDQRQLDPRDGGGGWPSDESAKQALRARGWLDYDDSDISDTHPAAQG